MRLTPPARATNPMAILIQRAKHVHLKVQLLILLEQILEVIILLMDLFSEFLNMALILLRTQLQLLDPYFQLMSLLIMANSD